jgi:hypothetical protein
MCAKSHIKYRDARKGLSETSDFPQKEGVFCPENGLKSPQKGLKLARFEL